MVEVRRKDVSERVAKERYTPHSVFLTYVRGFFLASQPINSHRPRMGCAPRKGLMNKGTEG